MASLWDSLEEQRLAEGGLDSSFEKLVVKVAFSRPTFVCMGESQQPVLCSNLGWSFNILEQPGAQHCWLSHGRSAALVGFPRGVTIWCLCSAAAGPDLPGGGKFGGNWWEDEVNGSATACMQIGQLGWVRGRLVLPSISSAVSEGMNIKPTSLA